MIRIIVILFSLFFYSHAIECSAIHLYKFHQNAPKDQVDAGEDQSVCGNMVQLEGKAPESAQGEISWSTTGKGKFVPDQHTLNAQYIKDEADPIVIEFVLEFNKNAGKENDSEGNDKNKNTDNMFVTFLANSRTDAGEDQRLCNKTEVALDGDASLLASSILWSGGEGTFEDETSLNTVYTPTPGEIMAGEITLTLTTQQAGLCRSADNVTITFLKAATIDAGEDQTVCKESNEVNLKGIVSPINPISWTGGKGKFENDTSLSTTYLPTEDELEEGSVKLTLATINTSCNNQDEITIIFAPGTSINAGEDQTVCEGTNEINLEGTSGSATPVLWTGGEGKFSSDTSLVTTYLASAKEIATGSVTLTLNSSDRVCKNQDNVKITFVKNPLVDAGEDQILCGETVEVALKGDVSPSIPMIWSGGSGKFSNDTAITTTYLPGAQDFVEGSVTLTLSSGKGTECKIQDKITLVFSPGITLNAGEDQNLCGNIKEVSLKATSSAPAKISWSGGAGKFSDDTSLSTTYTPTSNEINKGSVTLIITADQRECPSKDNVTITFGKGGILNAGEDQEMCGDVNEITLKGLSSSPTPITWSGGNGTFENDTLLETVYHPAEEDFSAGSITLSLSETGTNGCKGEDKITITFSKGVTLNAGDDQNVCVKSSNVSLKASVTPAAEVFWSGGSGTFSNDTSLVTIYTPSADDIAKGTISLTLTSGKACKIQDNVSISFSPGANIDAGKDQLLCGKVGEAQLKGTVTPSVPIRWTGGKGTFSNDTSLTSTYTPSLEESKAGMVTLTLSTSDEGACTSVDKVKITFAGGSTVEAGNDLQFCTEVKTIPLKGSFTGGAKIKWETNGDGIFFPSDSVIDPSYQLGKEDAARKILKLTLTATDLCGKISDTLTVDLPSYNQINAGEDISVCKTVTNIKLQAKVTGDTSNIKWTSSGTGNFVPSENHVLPTYAPSSEDLKNGFILLYLNNVASSKCATSKDSIKISFTDRIVSSAGEDIELCKGGTAKLNGKISGNNAGLWKSYGSGILSSPNDLNTTYVPSTEDIEKGLVKLTLSPIADGNCKSAPDTLKIIIRPITSPVLDSIGDKILCAGENANLNNFTLNNFKYTWHVSHPENNFNNPATGETEEILSSPTSNTFNTALSNNGTKDTTYHFTLMVTNTTSGCGTSKDIKVKVYPALKGIAGNDTALCSGQLITLGKPAKDNVIYQWSPPEFLSDDTSANPVLKFENTNQATKELKYTVKASFANTNACAIKDSILIRLIPSSTELTIKDTSICAGAEFTLGNSNNPSSYQYMWSPKQLVDNDTVASPKFLSPDSVGEVVTENILVNAISPEGCRSVDSVKIKIAPSPLPKITSLPDQIFCGTPFKAVYSVKGATTSKFDWDITGGQILQGQGTTSVNVNWDASLNKYLSVTETSMTGCSMELVFEVDETSNGIVIDKISKENGDDFKNYVYWHFTSKENQPERIVVKRIPAFPDADSIVINKIKNKFDSIFVDNFMVNPEKSYVYTLSYFNNCGNEIKSNGQRNLALTNQSKDNNVAINWSLLENGNGRLKGFEVWKKDDEKPYVLYTTTDTSTYSIQFPDLSSTSTCFRVKALDQDSALFTWSNEICMSSELKIPNAITPNGDNINDEWTIEHLNLLPNYEITIFNQWNVEVFNSSNYKNNWRGDGLTDGVYYYVIRSEKPTLKGYILVTR